MALLNWINVVSTELAWALPLLALLAGIILYRKHQREFPLFLVYVIATITIGFARLLAFRYTGQIYYYVYWISDIGIAVFAFLATYELFIKRLFPAFYKVNFFRYLFPIVAVALTLLGASTALYSGRLAVLLITVRIYEFLRATVLVFFLVLMIFMGRRWTKQEFGIAFGFGLDVSAAFAILAIIAKSGDQSGRFYRIPTFAYDIACLVWLYCFWPAPKTSSLPQLPPDALNEAKKWEGSLKDFIAPGKH